SAPVRSFGVAVSCLLGHLVVSAGCGADPRGPAERAEPAAEPTLVAEGFVEPEDGLRIDGAITFSSGVTIGPRAFAPALAQAGEAVVVRFPVAGLAAGAQLRVGLRAPQAAGRQEARGQASVPKGEVDDPRDRWAVLT